MTTKDLIEITGCSRSTLIRMTAKMYPGLGKKGKATIYTEEQGIALIKALPKANVVQMEQVAVPNGTSSPQLAALTNLVERQSANIDKLGAMVAAMLQKQGGPAQIEAPSHYTVMGYAAKLHRSIDTVKARSLSFQARGICAEGGLEVHKVPDERYGEVNSYPVEVLAEVFA